MKVVQGPLETSDQMVGSDTYWPTWPCLNYLKIKRAERHVPCWVAPGQKEALWICGLLVTQQEDAASFQILP